MQLHIFIYCQNALLPLPWAAFLSLEKKPIAPLRSTFMTKVCILVNSLCFYMICGLNSCGSDEEVSRSTHVQHLDCESNELVLVFL